MEKQNYYNQYLETLTNYLTDSVLRNVSLQTTQKINEETIKEYEKTIGLMDAEIGKLKEQWNEDKIKRESVETYNTKNFEDKIKVLSDELVVLRSMKEEYENIKHQVQHLETFRNELLKSREENRVLQEKIEEMQTPTKRKKLETTNIKNNSVVPVQPQDGGSF